MRPSGATGDALNVLGNGRDKLAKLSCESPVSVREKDRFAPLKKAAKAQALRFFARDSPVARPQTAATSQYSPACAKLYIFKK
jgi:hypothetical protein